SDQLVDRMADYSKARLERLIGHYSIDGDLDCMDCRYSTAHLDTDQANPDRKLAYLDQVQSQLREHTISTLSASARARSDNEYRTWLFPLTYLLAIQSLALWSCY